MWSFCSRAMRASLEVLYHGIPVTTTVDTMSHCRWILTVYIFRRMSEMRQPHHSASHPHPLDTDAHCACLFWCIPCLRVANTMRPEHTEQYCTGFAVLNRLLFRTQHNDCVSTMDFGGTWEELLCLRGRFGTGYLFLSNVYIVSVCVCVCSRLLYVLYSYMNKSGRIVFIHHSHGDWTEPWLTRIVSGSLSAHSALCRKTSLWRSIWTYHIYIRWFDMELDVHLGDFGDSRLWCVLCGTIHRAAPESNQFFPCAFFKFI